MKTSLVKLSCVCDSGNDFVKQYKVQECFDIGAKCDC